MNPLNRPITSREYKLMLNINQFENLEQGVKDFWGEVMSLVKKQKGTIPEPDQDEILERQTWYLDTPGFKLRGCHKFVLRLREEKKKTVKGVEEEIKKRKNKITLKYRSPNRKESAKQDVSVSQKVKDMVREKDIETKFEEDVLPAKRMFSHSTSVKQKELPDLSNINEVVAFFPDLEKLEIPKETPIETVNGRKVFELAYRVGQIDFGGTVKACLSFWYSSAKKNGLPLVAEFSFDYESEVVEGEEQFNPKMVEKTEQFFKALQQELDWFDFKGTTKTAYAYGKLNAVECLEAANKQISGEVTSISIVGRALTENEKRRLQALESAAADIQSALNHLK